MAFRFLNIRVVAGRKQLLIVFGIMVAWMTLVSSNFDPVISILLLGIIFLVLRTTTKPLAQFIARLGYSIRWKFEVGIATIAVLFLIVTLIQIGAMNFMHGGLHDIQELMAARDRTAVFPAINNLEDTHHGPFYRLLPFLGVLGVLGAAAVGGAMAWSVIDPVRRMEQAMQRLAAGDFSQPVFVENQDELGELAARINQTSDDLARLQETTLATERDQALRERIMQVALAQEEERRRISRELHDGLGPSLASIGLRLRSCQSVVHNNPKQAEEELQDVADGLKGHVQDIRALIHDLRPLALDQLGLTGAVKQYAERFGQESGIGVTVNASGEATLGPLAEVTIFRVVQESLNNVQKHADASQVEVTLLANESGLEAAVKDNGRGFDPSSVAPGRLGPGMGLLSMRERAEMLGGSLSVGSSPGSGCEVLLHIPAREIEVGAHSSPPGG